MRALSLPSGILVQLARFSGALRGLGIQVGLSDAIDAATALTLVDLLDREEVRQGLRISLKVPPDAWPAFDRLFEQYWGGVAAAPPLAPHAQNPPRHRRAALQWRWDGQRVRLVAGDDSGTRAGEQTPGYTSEALLRRKPFEQFSPADTVRMERLLARLAMRLAAHKKRRLVPARARGLVDDPVRVLTPAGPLNVRWNADDILLAGPAEIVARGEFYYQDNRG